MEFYKSSMYFFNLCGGKMFSKKLITFIAILALSCGFSANAFAELFSVSVGIPFQHNFTSEWDGGDTVESDGTSGMMVHVKFPIMLGLGYETYETKLKSFNDSIVDDMKLTINMIDVFWLTPIPIVNVTVGAGIGTTKFDCEYQTNNDTCDDLYKSPTLGSAYQWYGQLGYNFMPFFDVHLSYHNVTAKVEEEDGGDTSSFNGSVLGIGVAFIF